MDSDIKEEHSTLTLSHARKQTLSASVQCCVCKVFCNADARGKKLLVCLNVVVLPGGISHWRAWKSSWPRFEE